MICQGSGGRALSGVQGQSPWSGGQGKQSPPPEAEALLFFGRSKEAANLHSILQFASAKKFDICVISAKNHRWPLNWGKGWSKTGGPVLPSSGPGPKTATG